MKRQEDLGGHKVDQKVIRLTCDLGAVDLRHVTSTDRAAHPVIVVIVVVGRGHRRVNAVLANLTQIVGA